MKLFYWLAYPRYNKLLDNIEKKLMEENIIRTKFAKKFKDDERYFAAAQARLGNAEKYAILHTRAR